MDFSFQGLFPPREQLGVSGTSAVPAGAVDWLEEYPRALGQLWGPVGGQKSLGRAC